MLKTKSSRSEQEVDIKHENEYTNDFLIEC